MSIHRRVLAGTLIVAILIVGCGGIQPSTLLSGSRGAAGQWSAGSTPGRIAISPARAAEVKALYALSGHRPSVAGLAFLAGGSHLASVSKDLALRLWDLGSGQEVRSPDLPAGRVYNAAFSPGGARLATESADGAIRLWDVDTGQEVRSLGQRSTALMALAFSSDGGLLALAGEDGSIELWDVQTGRAVRTLSGHITPVTALAFSPDGTLLASGSSEYCTIIKLWDLESGEERRVLTGHSGSIHTLAFSPDGAFLASAGDDRTARVWNLQNGQRVYLFTTREQPAYGLAFSPDSAILALSGDNGAIQLWDLASGQELCTLSGHKETVLHLAFSPDGSLLASGGLDDAVILWGIPGKELARGEPMLPNVAPVSTVAGAHATSPAPLGAKGGLIVFSSYRDGESKIFTMNPDGSAVTSLSRTGLRDTRPKWSPDGTHIAYVRRVGFSNHEIFVMNVDGSGTTRLTLDPDSVESEPAWSPDGSRIAFISNRSLNANTFLARFNIFVMSADGSDQILLTDIGGSNTSPDWSPAAAGPGRIAFDSTRDGNHEIYLIDADGSHLLNLTNHPANDISPAWSPDGGKIAFVSDRDGDPEIYVMAADGSNPTRLTDAPGFDYAPAWSPDGQHIVFYACREAHNTEIYRIRADGSELIQLTDDAEFDGFPDWQPLPLTVAAPGALPGIPALDQSSVGDLVASLEGLPLDRFFEESFKLLMLRDPEWVTSEGLAGRFEVGNDQLTDISDAYIRETQRLQAAILQMLRKYDRQTLSPEQQISYDVYEWYLDDLLRGQEFMYYDFPVTHFVTGVQNQLIQFFTDIHPIASRQDAEDYITRLYQVDAKFEGLIEGLQLREQAGVILPRFIFPWLMGDISHIAHGQARFTPFYAAFEEKVNALDDLSPGDRKALLQAAEVAIEESIIPAFAALERTLRHLESAAPRKEGVWQFPRGNVYYDYILRHHTTTTMTADEIHLLGLRELKRIHAEMRAVFDGLGYPQDESLPELYARLARDSGSVSGAAVAETYQAIIEKAGQDLGVAFDVRPQADVVVIAGNLGDYYLSASLDGSRPGAFYARVDGGAKDLYGMPTLAYHETIPGHHFQIAIAQESDLPLFRNVVVFTGYAEGWALYAEQLAYELGWYEHDPYGNLGRLQDQAFRAARLVVDTGIHTKGWTFDQAHEFMVENVGRDPGFLEFEVSRYITWPGQATAYMVGMLKMIELRQRAMERLGERFDLKEFHRVVLSNGSMPLEILERVVDRYIESKLNQ